MDTIGQGCNLPQYTYLLVMIAVITMKLRSHHPTVVGKR